MSALIGHNVRRAVDVVRIARWVTRERVIRWGVGFAVLSTVVLTGFAVLNWTADVPIRYMGADFANYWAGALLAASGHAGVAYDLTGFDAFEKSLFGPTFAISLYDYPPVHMLMTLPVAALPFVPAFIAWNLAGLVLCAASLSRVVGRRVAALAIVAAPASALTMMGGNSGELTAALLGGGLLQLDRNPVLAGVLLGLVSGKPQLGVLIPIALAAGARWRAFAAATATVLGMATVSAAVLGPESWVGFLHQVVLYQGMMVQPGAFWARSQSVFPAAISFGASVALAYAVQACSAVLAAGATFVVWRGGSSLPVKSAVLIVATFLATTYARDYDTVALVFAAAWLAGAGGLTSFLPWERIVVVMLLVEPMMIDTVTALTGVQFAPLALVLALAVLLRRAFAESAQDVRLGSAADRAIAVPPALRPSRTGMSP